MLKVKIEKLFITSAGEDAREPAGRAGFSRSQDYWRLPRFFCGLTSAIRNGFRLRLRGIAGQRRGWRQGTAASRTQQSLSVIPAK